MRGDSGYAYLPAGQAEVEFGKYEVRIKALEKQCATLAAEIDAQRKHEQALSDAYLRLRKLIGRQAFDTPHGPTGEQVWTTTETALTALVKEADTMRPIVEAAVKWNKTNYRDTQEIEFALDRLGEVCDDYEENQPK